MAIRVIPIEDKETPDSPVQDIGISLPFIFPNIESTRTTAAAIKSNIRNLLATERGERIMQPFLGIDLKKHLFQPVSVDTSIAFQEDLEKQLKIWYPFIIVKNVKVNLKNDQNIINFEVTFSYKQSPSVVESIQIDVDTGDAGGTY